MILPIRFALSSFAGIAVLPLAMACGSTAGEGGTGGAANDSSTDETGSGGTDGDGAGGASGGSDGASSGGNPASGGAVGDNTGGNASGGEAGGAGEECTEGDSMPADDGCNTCHCTGGSWACTQVGCSGQVCGGFAGFTCDDEDEYCAYKEGDLCGAGDASAFCEPRATGCTLEYDPVCGCDQMTYSNPCVAAAAGQGIYASGECN